MQRAPHSNLSQRSFNLRHKAPYHMKHAHPSEFSNAQAVLAFPLSASHPSQAELAEYLDYDPKTGILTNKRQRGVSKAGKEVGTVETSRAGKQYRRMWFKGRRYYAHVLIAIMIGIAVPALEVDHMDGDGLNNAAYNLRTVTHSENMKNRKPRPVQ